MRGEDVVLKRLFRRVSLFAKHAVKRSEMSHFMLEKEISLKEYFAAIIASIKSRRFRLFVVVFA